MKFRTEIEVTSLPRKIDYGQKIVSLGSCFAQNIAQLLDKAKFNIVSSPTGILFNPASIATAIADMLDNKQLRREELVELNGRWVSYDFHSSISGATPDEALHIMQSARECGAKHISEAEHLIITLGTAWVYSLNADERIVANCHKQPARLFTRRLLTVEEIVRYLSDIASKTSAQIILTLSPVRHIGEGLVDNSLSKALLRVAIDKVCNEHSNVTYFPAYEILIDDLRDYRFYDDDLVHPSSSAIRYIADNFFEAALSTYTKELKTKVERIVQAASHRPINPHSQQHQEFCHRQLELIAEMKNIDFSREKEIFEQMLQINL